MGRRRLITDSFQVVKKRKRGNKKVQEGQSPPLDKVIVQAECLPQDAAQPEELELLKQFDLSWKYGPCTGITRLQRWERADSLGLGPPAAVQELLLKYNRDPVVTHSLWHEYSL
ncbi:DNA polymerase delta subunit 4 isoform X2 [Varanus komodoensis]|uniref:DNA polymerase delta subunit 4 isoform X2 n=1 Tax=Varanus komodoensis TaxID=61221 RepID=UPI001CF7E86B|nr:DNA polymerase delta subunit 4 isoform X2 [Varanus komodoensis]